MASTNHWIGEKYHQNSTQQKIVADLLISQFSFKGDEQILDVGCGDGKITAELGEKIPHGKILGIDSSDSMISFAKKNYGSSSCQFEICLASALTFSSQFDLITSFSSLHWEPKQKETLDCFRRALHPKGFILLAIPGPDLHLRNSLRKICIHPDWARFFLGYQSPGRIWTANEYAELLIDTGFSIQKIEVVDRPYAVNNINEYRGLIDGMLPHLSQIPSALHSSFIDQIVTDIYKEGQKDSKGRLLFQVKVLEVIAYV